MTEDTAHRRALEQRDAYRKLYPQLKAFDPPTPRRDLEIERRVWQEAAALVSALRATARGLNPREQGQRRACTRLLDQIAVKLSELDDGKSWSEDDIDEGLKA